MIVDINRDYRVRTSPGNYVLEKVFRDDLGEIKKTKAGKERTKTLGFYNSMKLALHSALQYDMEDKYTKVTMQKYLEIYHEEVDSLNQLLPKVGDDNEE